MKVTRVTFINYILSTKAHGKSVEYSGDHQFRHVLLLTKNVMMVTWVTFIVPSQWTNRLNTKQQAKYLSYKFLKDGLAAQILRGTCKGGQFFAAYLWSNLKATNTPLTAIFPSDQNCLRKPVMLSRSSIPEPYIHWKVVCSRAYPSSVYIVLVWYNAEWHVYLRGFDHITKLLYRGLLVALSIFFHLTTLF